MAKDGSYTAKSRRAGGDCQAWFLSQRSLAVVR
jgi:hypothetical protein